MKLDASLFDGVRAARAHLHDGARIEGTNPLVVVTPASRWQYALSVPYEGRWRLALRTAEPLVVEADLEVEEGEIGVACARTDQQTILSERSAAPQDGRTVLRQRVTPTELGWVIFRNVAAGAAPSRFRLHRLRVATQARGELLGMVDIARRRFAIEPVPEGGGVESFEDEGARRINEARLATLAELELPLQGKRVLDVGCGVGHFSRFFVERGCRYVGVDGRAENVARMKDLYPDVEGYVGDVQNDPLAPHGRFDVVLCFGLLYHLENPVGALRNVASVCDDVLLLETMVCDASKPLLLLADESRSFNQALAGLGCRPSPSFLVMTLNRIGFERIYTPRIPPRHEDFEVEWRDDLARQRDGHDLRCMLLASRRPLSHDSLHSIL